MNNTESSDKKLWVHYQKDQPEVFSSTHDRHNKVLNQIKKFLNPGMKLLEIGFGDGYLLEKLSKDYNCWGADIDSEIIENSKKNLDKVEFKIMDTDGKLPFESDFFDGFIASEVLEHMEDVELSTCVREISRILKKGGYGFITVPADENLSENECFCPNCLTKFHKWGHKQSWNTNKIRRVFKDLNIVKIQRVFVSSGELNIFGKIDLIARKIMSVFLKKNIGGSTFLIVIKKK